MTVERTLEGKVAVITGGGRGLGKAVAAALIERGAKVVIGNTTVAQGTATVDEFNAAAGCKVAAFKQTDITTYKDNIALFQFAEKEFGGVDIAYLNAGVAGNATDIIFLPPDDENDARAMNVNAVGTMKGTKIAMLHLAKRGGGVIINCSSTLGSNAVPSMSAYVASKHAMNGWTRCFSMLPQICNVRVNAVCPHFVETDMLVPNPDQLSRGGPVLNLVDKIPKTTTENVVNAVLLLIEDETRNAQTLMALPGDVIREQEPAPPAPETITPEFVELMGNYAQDYVTFHKKELEDYLKVYEKQYGNKE
ncbi:hypothetical protein BDB00DRAFT_179129 [Zychaea mexicana]|uniref:uncharacterized protein n=1 Tax=Zychaea mexicana TaxID=64656 RepID=UPI0022FF1742|nr:uncharacterized protein BDB00DRAFT_179129 [Zychaea mexicana]KAI9495975.1 hypothetical protein BDB00DRAFT_179129 [Zychaea mexicana]